MRRLIDHTALWLNVGDWSRSGVYSRSTLQVLVHLGQYKAGTAAGASVGKTISPYYPRSSTYTGKHLHEIFKTISSDPKLLSVLSPLPPEKKGCHAEVLRSAEDATAWSAKVGVVDRGWKCVPALQIERISRGASEEERG